MSEKTVKKYADMQDCDIPKEKQTVRGREHEEAVAKLLERAGRVKALSESELSIREIAQKTGFTDAVVKIYLSSDFSPVNAHYGKQREGKLEPFREDVLKLNEYDGVREPCSRWREPPSRYTGATITR